MDGSIMQRKLSQDTAPIRCTRLATVCVTARCTSACARTVRLLIVGVDEGSRRERERAASLTPLTTASLVLCALLPQQQCCGHLNDAQTELRHLASCNPHDNS